MVDVAQQVRASDCGSEGRGFEPHLPPRFPGTMISFGDFFDVTDKRGIANSEKRKAKSERRKAKGERRKAKSERRKAKGAKRYLISPVKVVLKSSHGVFW